MSSRRLYIEWCYALAFCQQTDAYLYGFINLIRFYKAKSDHLYIYEQDVLIKLVNTIANSQ